MEESAPIPGGRSPLTIARGLFLLGLGVMLFFLIPTEGFPFLVGKIAWFSIFVALAFTGFAVSSIRAGSLHLPSNMLVKATFLLLLAYAFATALSQDWSLSLAGFGAETDSLLFMVVAVATFFLSAVLFKTRESVHALFTTLLSATALVGFFQLIRLFAGEKFFASTVFTSTSTNLVGSWYDFGIVVALLAVLSAGFIDSRRASLVKFLALCVLLVSSLAILTVVNFQTLWWLLIGSSFVIAYGTMRVVDADAHMQDSARSLPRIPFASVLVVLVAGTFLFWGSSIVPKIQKIVTVSVAEAQLTPQTTLEVMRSTYAQSALTTFFGSGPNTFGQQWLLYKPASLTNSQYWTLDFTSGFSTLFTSFVTSGLVAGLLLLLIPVLALIYFFRAIASVRDNEKREIIVLLSSVLTLLFGAVCFYAPGQVVVILAFSVLGAFVVWTKTNTHLAVVIGRGKLVGTSILALAVVVLLVCAGMYAQRFLASRYEGKASIALSKGDTLSAEYNGRRSLAVYRSDRALNLLASLKFSEAQKIATETDKATESTRAERFQVAVGEASSFATSAVVEYPKHWTNWLALAQLNEALIPLKVEGAYQRSREAYANAIRLSPRNPQLYLMLARMEQKANNEQNARLAVNQALTLKQNYTDAILFVVQLEIAKNNIEGALNAAIAAVQTAPTNAGLWFQVGVLAFNKEDDKMAKQALEKAIELAPDYANAKYFLGLVQYRLGNVGESVALFEGLATTNPNNTEIVRALSAIKAGKSPIPPKEKTPATAPVKEN